MPFISSKYARISGSSCAFSVLLNLAILSLSPCDNSVEGKLQILPLAGLNGIAPFFSASESITFFFC